MNEFNCMNCQDTGIVIVEVPEYNYVTRDMAIDACDMSLHGTRIMIGTTYEETICDSCDAGRKLLQE